MSMLNVLFPDDEAARNRRYAAIAVDTIDADIAAGRLEDVEYSLEQRAIMVMYRDAS